jgi:hypothetical protein
VQIWNQTASRWALRALISASMGERPLAGRVLIERCSEQILEQFDGVSWPRKIEAAVIPRGEKVWLG